MVIKSQVPSVGSLCNVDCSGQSRNSWLWITIVLLISDREPTDGIQTGCAEPVQRRKLQGKPQKTAMSKHIRHSFIHRGTCGCNKYQLPTSMVQNEKLKYWNKLQLTAENQRGDRARQIEHGLRDFCLASRFHSRLTGWVFLWKIFQCVPTWVHAVERRWIKSVAKRWRSWSPSKWKVNHVRKYLCS